MARETKILHISCTCCPFLTGEDDKELKMLDDYARHGWTLCGVLRIDAFHIRYYFTKRVPA